MAKVQRTRQDPRREATRGAIIEAAERLFAAQGIESVSTRQIAAAIGALNTNVVAYHFGGKGALIEAVFHHRLPEIDRRRGELLGQLMVRNCAPDIVDLIRVFALPLFEQRDSDGKHSYARFVADLEHSGLVAARAAVSADYPQTERVTQALVSRLGSGVAREGHLRLRMVFSLVATGLQALDREPDLSPDDANRRFDTFIAMAAAAFGATAAQGARV